MTKGLRGSWARPAFGAAPMDPFPGPVVLRAGLIVLFFAYQFAGEMGDWRPLLVVTAVVVVGHNGGTALWFWRTRRNETPLLRAWSWALLLDHGVIALITACDQNAFSPVPLLSTVAIYSASAMFDTRSLLLMTAAATAFVGLSESLRHNMVAETDPDAHVFVAALVIFSGGFAAYRGRGEGRLRERLVGAERVQREQGEQLREALEAARVSQSRFEGFSAHAPAALMLYDPAGQPSFVSDWLTEEIGTTLELLRTDEERARLLRPGEREQLRVAIDKAVAGKASGIEFSLRDMHEDWRRISAVLFPVEGGAGFVGLDITAERALQSQVVRAQQLETLGTLAGGIAHDFNNLLTAILGNLFLAAGELPEEGQAREYVAEAGLAAERGADLVRRLMHYSRPMLEAMEPVALCGLIEETAKLAERALTPQVELRVEDVCEGTVLGSFGALQQVLLNLMVNGRDAMPTGGRLTVRCAKTMVAERDLLRIPDIEPGVYFDIQVSDTGTGIAPDAAERLFDPFFTTKEVGKGTGLGLSTALGIVRAHGGALTFDTRLGEGTTFRVLLPAVKPGAVPKAGANTAA